MDKHNLVIIILVIFLIGSLSFSFVLMSSKEEQVITANSGVDGFNEESLGKENNLAEDKVRLEAEKLQLEEKLELAEKQKAVLEVEKDSPFDHVKDKQVRVLKNKVEIDMKDVSWWTIADTNSMDPLIDEGSTALSVKPISQESIHNGDVAFYNSLIAKKVIVHRVIKIDNDEQGWYSKFKGDNLIEEDPENVRYPQIEGVLIGVIY
ncbi:MAG: hypothetical protein ABIH82_02145 [Candidatus Woesearchaeota archaeon]